MNHQESLKAFEGMPHMKAWATAMHRELFKTEQEAKDFISKSGDKNLLYAKFREDCYIVGTMEQIDIAKKEHEEFQKCSKENKSLMIGFYALFQVMGFTACAFKDMNLKKMNAMRQKYQQRKDIDEERTQFNINPHLEKTCDAVFERAASALLFMNFKPEHVYIEILGKTISFRINRIQTDGIREYLDHYNFSMTVNYSDGNTVNPQTSFLLTDYDANYQSKPQRIGLKEAMKFVNAKLNYRAPAHIRELYAYTHDIGRFGKPVMRLEHETSDALNGFVIKTYHSFFVHGDFKKAKPKALLACEKRAKRLMDRKHGAAKDDHIYLKGIRKNLRFWRKVLNNRARQIDLPSARRKVRNRKKISTSKTTR